ncbi:hypothetical protein [Pseudoxanthomonas mexicana]
MFKKDASNKKPFGVSDPLKRKFLVGFFVGAVVGIGIGRLLALLN